MNRHKDSRKNKNKPYEEKTFNLQDSSLPKVSKKEVEVPQPHQEPEKAIYSYTKHGDYFNLGCAGFFAFMFIFPAITITMAGNLDFIGFFVCMLLGAIPLRFLFKEIYQKEAILTNKEVKYYESSIFKKTIIWKEPISFYNYLSEQIVDDNSEAILWHSSDDSKNVTLYSSYYKYNKDVFKKIEELESFLKKTDYGKQQKHLQLKRREGYTERSFFEVYNRSKIESRSLKRILFPDNHLKILKDEDQLFMVSINKNNTLFILGLSFLALSFFILPFAFEVNGMENWVLPIHFLGVLLFNLGSTEQVLQLQKRSLKIGKRWLKRTLTFNQQIAFADIKAFEVTKKVSATDSKEIYFLKIITTNSFYEFARSQQKEELEWLAEVLIDRIICINGIFNASIQTNYYNEY